MGLGNSFKLESLYEDTLDASSDEGRDSGDQDCTCPGMPSKRLDQEGVLSKN